MRTAFSLLVFVTVACATVGPPPVQTILSGTDPFVCARRFVLRSHTDPRFQGSHRLLEQRGERLLIRVVRPHAGGKDVVELTFEPDPPGTRVALTHWHLDAYGRRVPCDLSPELQEAVVELLTTPDPEVDDRMGTMALSSGRIY